MKMNRLEGWNLRDKVNYFFTVVKIKTRENFRPRNKDDEICFSVSSTSILGTTAYKIVKRTPEKFLKVLFLIVIKTDLERS
jgi:hypothetical protein